MRRIIAMWCVVGSVAVGCISAGASHWWTAWHAATEQRDRARSVAAHIDELASLRQRRPEWMRRGTPAAGLSTRVSGTLAACGVGPSALSGVSPEAESPVGDAELKARRSRAVVTLANLTLPQVGAFLKEWRTREPGWTVSTIDLSPQNALSAAAGGDLPVRAVIGLEALFVDGGERR